VSEQTKKSTQTLKTAPGWALLQLGFRPFFWLAAVAAVVLVAGWLYLWASGAVATPYGAPQWWHLHEMLFGFCVAVIAGFLLTAASNWSGTDTASGGMLALLAAVWLLGRLLPWFAVLPRWLPAVIDVAFLPLLAGTLARALWASPQKTNRVFLALLLTMAASNVAFHLGINTDLPLLTQRAGALMLCLVILTVAWLSGRVLPFFTARAVPDSTPQSQPWLGRTATGLLLMWAVLWPFLPRHWLTAAIALAAAAVHVLRLYRWHHPLVWRIPILAVLHVAYGWLALGLGLVALAAAGFSTPGPAVHALTMGAIGGFTLGMMTRVSLGHSGRPVAAPVLMVVAFAAINLAALIRVFGSLALPAHYSLWIASSGALWVLGFALFLVLFTPVLFTPRADGQPG